MKEKIFNLIKNIIPKKSTLFCPHCKLWIGMSKQDVEKHLAQFRDVNNKNTYNNKEKIQNDCNNGKCD
jgi:hypothetical protein